MRGPSDWSSSTGSGGGKTQGIGGGVIGILFAVMISGIVFVTVAVTLLPIFVGFDSRLVSVLVWIVPWLLPVVIFGFVFIFLIVSLLTASRTESTTADTPTYTSEMLTPPETQTVQQEPTDPLDVLKERYASGEISIEEYERAVGLLVDANTAEEAHRRLERGDHEEVVGLDDLDVGSDPESEDANVTIELSVEEVEALIDEIHDQDV